MSVVVVVLVLVEAVAVVVVVLVEVLIYYHNYHNHNHEYYHCPLLLYLLLYPLYYHYFCYYIHPIRWVQLATYCKNYDGNNIQQYANNTTTIYFLPVFSEEGRAIFPRRRLQYTVLLLVSKLQIKSSIWWDIHKQMFRIRLLFCLRPWWIVKRDKHPVCVVTWNTFPRSIRH